MTPVLTTERERDRAVGSVSARTNDGAKVDSVRYCRAWGGGDGGCGRGGGERTYGSHLLGGAAVFAGKGHGRIRIRTSVLGGSRIPEARGRTESGRRELDPEKLETFRRPTAERGFDRNDVTGCPLRPARWGGGARTGDTVLGRSNSPAIIPLPRPSLPRTSAGPHLPGSSRARRPDARPRPRPGDGAASRGRGATSSDGPRAAPAPDAKNLETETPRPGDICRGVATGTSVATGTKDATTTVGTKKSVRGGARSRSRGTMISRTRTTTATSGSPGRTRSSSRRSTRASR